MKTKFFSFFLFLCYNLLFAQEQKSNENIYVIGFYNLENFFDLEDNPDKNDNDFLPDGAYHWTQDKYEEKQVRMANILGKLGSPMSSTPPVAIGVCEVENLGVLNDLINQEPFKNYNVIILDQNNIENPSRVLARKSESGNLILGTSDSAKIREIPGFEICRTSGFETLQLKHSNPAVLICNDAGFQIGDQLIEKGDLVLERLDATQLGLEQGKVVVLHRSCGCSCPIITRSELINTLWFSF